MKAIETIYHGYRFRSRLEARWAVFFDALGITYEYEPQGFDLDGVWYLPDFWLPEQGCWAEIKGVSPTEEEQTKARRFALHSGKPVHVFSGEICVPDPRPNLSYSFYPGEESSVFGSFHECIKCHKIGIVQDILFLEIQKLERLPCTCYRELGILDPVVPDVFIHHRPFFIKIWIEMLVDQYDSVSPRLDQAYIVARQARFEHGEMP